MVLPQTETIPISTMQSLKSYNVDNVNKNKKLRGLVPQEQNLKSNGITKVEPWDVHVYKAEGIICDNLVTMPEMNKLRKHKSCDVLLMYVI